LELGRNNATALDTRGHIYEVLEQKAKAIADFRKAIELGSSNEESKKALKRLSATEKKNDDKTTATTGTSQDMEITFWNSVKDSDDPAMLQAYLDQFPKGTFAALAKIKLKKAQ